MTCRRPAGRRPTCATGAGSRCSASATGCPNKGVLELLDAVAALPADHVTLHLAGRADVDPAYTGRVRARLPAPDLAGRVVVHGAVDRDEVAGLYAGADVFVLASYAETYGTVFAEALAAGLPDGRLAIRQPAQPHRGRREGCLVEPGDVAGLSAALRRLATDDEWRDDRSPARRCAAARRCPPGTTPPTPFFGALSRLARRPRLNQRTTGPVRLDVDARHARVLDVHPPRDRRPARRAPTRSPP